MCPARSSTGTSPSSSVRSSIMPVTRRRTSSRSCAPAKTRTRCWRWAGRCAPWKGSRRPTRTRRPLARRWRSGPWGRSRRWSTGLWTRSRTPCGEADAKTSGGDRTTRALSPPPPSRWVSGSDELRHAVDRAPGPVKPVPRPELLRGALLLALLRPEDQETAGQRRRDPLQDALLLLQLGHLVRRALRRHGPAFHRSGAGFGGDLGTEDAAVHGGTDSGCRKHRLDHRVGSRALLAANPVTVSRQQPGPADQVRADGRGGDGGPARPSRGRDSGPLGRILDVLGPAVDPDGPHQGAAEPGGGAEVVHGPDDRIAIARHEDSSCRH